MYNKLNQGGFIKKLILIATLLFANSALAQYVGVVGGLNYTGGGIDAGNNITINFDREFGFQFGARYLLDLEKVQFRTGAALELYNSSLDAVSGGTTIKADYSSMYISIPVTFQKMFDEKFGLYGGLGVNISVNDDYDLRIDGTKIDADPETESLWITLQIGAVYMFTEVFGMELGYDYGLNDIAEDATASSFSLQIVNYF